MVPDLSRRELRNSQPVALAGVTLHEIEPWEFANYVSFAFKCEATHGPRSLPLKRNNLLF
jgi:hypothetical protein